MEKKLLQTRKSIKAGVTRIQTYVSQYNGDNIDQLQVRQGVLAELWGKYDTVQQQLEEIDGEAYEDDREHFETLYYDVMSTVSSLLRQNKDHEVMQVKTEPTRSSPQIKLPQISIPTFSGNYTEWNGFYDIFKSVIHDNENIATIQKYFYLKSALKGEALKTVEAFTTTEDNYAVALNVLIERYNNKNYLINAHFQAIFELSAVGRKVATHATELRKIIVDSKQHLKSLETLGLPVPQWDAIIIYILLQKLDGDTRRDWELSKVDNSLPSLNQLYQFLEKRCFSLEAASSSTTANEKKSQGENRQEKSREKYNSRVTYVASESRQVKGGCSLCNEKHELYHCEQFKRQEVGQRIKTVQSLKVCFNCLTRGHMARHCAAGSCRKCKRNHHTLLHLEAESESASSSTNNDSENRSPRQDQSATATEQTSLHNMKIEESQVLLSTAVIRIRDSKGCYQACRVLLDSASQSNFIKASCLRRLGCKTINKAVPIRGINGARVDATSAAVLEISSRFHDYFRKLEFLVLENITKTLPVERVQRTGLKLPDVKLADPEFGEPAQIDGLLGGEVFLELLMDGRIKLGNGLVILQNSVLGWIVAGRVNSGESASISQTCCLSTTDVSKQISKFWELEDCDSRHKAQTREERDCEAHFTATTQRDKTGRYIVRLPFNERKNQLGNSYNMALKRFYSLERRLLRNESLKHQYIDFMREYETLGHMKQCHDTRDGYFLPHQAVIKESSLTTKLRVVFDASAKTDTGISLNDTLMVGATLQEDLFSIIMRYRLHNIVFTADIEKMYRQVRVHDEDANYQKIIWRENCDDAIMVYKLSTVTYGTSSAPYLATRCLQQLAEDDGRQFPTAMEVIKRDFYMDDLLTGASTLEEAVSLRDDVIEIFTRGGLKLRKWSSNSAELLKTIPNQTKDPMLLLDITTTNKTLGVMWNAQADTLEYITGDVNTIAVTKRQIPSQIAQLFDPLGLMGPIIIRAKIIMQKLWLEKAGWDEQLEEETVEMWSKYRQELKLIHEIRIPRQVVQPFSTQIQLHGFCDSSEKAFGACIYLRSTTRQGETETRIVCSKSRVAPLKRVTLPRLELCAGLLLSQLYQRVKDAFKIEFSKRILWSDSTITLHWIATSSSALKTFVGNRVAQIQEVTQDCEWRHVRSQENPADVVSRGLHPGELKASELWWRGPSWIRESEENWPTNIMSTDIEELSTNLLERRPVTNITCLTMSISDMFYQYSTLVKLQRVIAYIFRFIRNAHGQREERTTGPLTVTELQNALQYLIKKTQEDAFNEEIRAIKINKAISRKSKLVKLRPLLDDCGILRVGGRLENAIKEYDQKHHIILPDKHPFTRLLIEQFHKKLLHGGTQAMLTSIRQLYWPLNARNSVKGVIHKCIRCLRLRKIETEQVMGNLPAVRVQSCRPFRNAGVDYGGPLIIKKSRNITTKAYIALFICMSTRAIHLELVSSLATEEFMGAFRRFVARRGSCANLYSDNGTNFRGASKELLELREFLQKQSNQDWIMTVAATEGTQWHFIPPGSPHMGGLWEAGIKSVKTHLKRVVGETKLSYEEMNTLLIQIEAIVNSRPLMPIHDEHNSISILTPAHFLIGEPLTLPAEPELRELPDNRLSRWQLVQKQMQSFWKRWHLEYLHTLQQRTKWYSDKDNVEVGMVVLIKENNVAPLQWRLGRIEEIHPGTDGKVRVVTMRTSGGHTMQRAINKIIILPTQEIETGVVKVAGMFGKRCETANSNGRTE